MTDDAVVAHDLTVRHGSHVALAGASFRCPAARVTSLVGPNGSGKSTLLGAVAGLLSPAGGTIAVLGGSPSEQQARIAYVLQSTDVNAVLPVAVREVVVMGRYGRAGLLGRLDATDRDAVDVALDRLGITDLARRSLDELSGGERQRVFVAQGLAQQADLLLLDEPVTGLDLVSRQLILDAVAEEAAAGRTVILSTHNLAEAAAGDQVLLLARRIVAQGPADEVLTGPHLDEAYGGRLLRLADGSAVLDDPHHH